MTVRDLIPCAVFAGPLVALLLATCFKMDGVMARPRTPPARRLIPQVDEDGLPLCLDPDGSSHYGTRKSS